MSAQRIKNCPRCLTIGRKIPVERYPVDSETYIVICTSDVCSFLETFKGEPVVNEIDLINFGLPGELIDHMDVYEEDLNKIFRLCLHEYCTNKYFTDSTLESQDNEELEKIILSLNEHAKDIVFDKNVGSTFELYKEALEESVSDITPEYASQVKNAFARIKNFKFLECLEINSASGIFFKEGETKEYKLSKKDE